MDAQVPTQRALAIAGGRIAGGVGVHETALASPEVVDLGGRTVLPGFSDSHVHFPTWALAQTEVKLDGCTSIAEALARIDAAERLPDGIIRGYGWRSGDWPGGEEPTATRLDAVTGETPAALIAKDYHSLWLNSAALALAGGDLEVEGGVVERDAAVGLVGERREDPVFAVELDHVPRKLSGLVDLGGAGRDPFAGQGSDEVADLALLGRQRIVAHGFKSRALPPITRGWKSSTWWLSRSSRASAACSPSSST